jgi:cold shock CspA family protein
MECGSDIFFHRINLVGNFRELAPGTPVEFTIGKDARQRRQALNVRPF